MRLDYCLIGRDAFTSLVIETVKCFGSLRPIGCLLSIGTGIPPQQALGQVGLIGVGDFVEGISAATTECEATHKQVETLSRTYLPDPTDEAKYFQFNYRRVLNKEGHEETYEKLIDLAGWKKMTPFETYVDIHLGALMGEQGCCADDSNDPIIHNPPPTG